MSSLRHALIRHFWPLFLALIGILFTGLMFWSLLRARIPGCDVAPSYGAVLPAAAAKPR